MGNLSPWAKLPCRSSTGGGLSESGQLESTLYLAVCSYVGGWIFGGLCFADIDEVDGVDVDRLAVLASVSA